MPDVMRTDSVADALLLLSASDSARLRLGPPVFDPAGGVTFLADLSGPVVKACVNVYELNTSELTRFFDSLAVDWRGWKGVKAYGSLEGQLTLDASCDSLGHVFVRVTIREDPGGPNWHAEGTLTLEAGQLERYALSCRRIFSDQRAA